MADNCTPPTQVTANDTIGKTLLVVLLLCLICSIVVTGSAVGLKSIQQQQKQLDQYRNILQVAGLFSAKMTPEQIMDTFHHAIVPRLVDLASGEFIAGDAGQFDPLVAAKDPHQSTLLTPSVDSAHIQQRANVQRVYLVRQQATTPKISTFSSVVLPVYGAGLWSMMYAFIAVDNDGNSVKGIRYYQHGETPGLGGEVENLAWQQQWIGKQLFDAALQPAIHLVKGSADPQDVHAIDALAGATLTTKGVQGTLDFWLGSQGYGPFLAKIRAGALNYD